MKYPKRAMWVAVWMVMGVLGQTVAMANDASEAQTDPGCAVPADIRGGQGVGQSPIRTELGGVAVEQGGVAAGKGEAEQPGAVAQKSSGKMVGDAARGRLVFATCRTCHYPEQSVGHNNGPSLWNIFALQVGSQPGFDYSPALRNAEFVWTPELLDLWLQDTVNFLPGNMMMSPGESDPQRRADLIEYLKQISTPPDSP